MHVANCEYVLLSFSCEMNASQSLFVVDLNERRSNSANLVWSIAACDLKIGRCRQLIEIMKVCGY